MSEKTACPLVPFNDQVVCQLLDPEEKTPGGLVLPANVSSQHPKALVCAVGPGWKSNDGSVRLALDVKVGHFRSDPGTLDLGNYFVISAANILCKVK